MFKVYIHQNLINHKIYIGITSLDIKERWGKNGNGYRKQSFYRAIQKYGWNNFRHVVLFDNLTEEDACQIEQELILFHKSNKSKFGYNADNGGRYAGKHSKKTRDKISKNVKRRKIICLETKEIFNSGIEASRKLNINYTTLMRVCKGKRRNKSAKGYHFKYYEEYDENKQYSFEVGSGYMVICLETKEIFNSATDASKKMKIDLSSICKVCNGNKLSVNKLHFKYLKDYDENKKYKFYSDRDTIKKAIMCIETNIKFESIKQAADIMSLNPTGICAVLRGKQKTTGGYTFKYIDK